MTITEFTEAERKSGFTDNFLVRSNLNLNQGYRIFQDFSKIFKIASEAF